MSIAETTLKLLPCFVAALAVQRATELVDVFVSQAKPSTRWSNKKAFYLFGVFAVTFIMVACSDDVFLILNALSITTKDWIDRVVSALIISGGTETINEILKFIGYKKDETKANARAQTLAQQGASEMPAQLLKS